MPANNVAHVVLQLAPRTRQPAAVRTRTLPPLAVARPPVAPPALHDAEAFGLQEERRRLRQNLAAVAVAVAIVFAGTWTINQIQFYSRIQACLDYGHRNCVPLNVGHVARPS